MHATLLLSAAIMAEGAAKPGTQAGLGLGQAGARRREGDDRVDRRGQQGARPRELAAARRNAVHRSRRPGDHRQEMLTPDETRKCAAHRDREGVPGAGQVLRARDPDGVDSGPMTVVALGHRRQRRLGRLLVRSRPKCLPVKVGAAKSGASGSAERKAKACAEADDALVSRRSEGACGERPRRPPRRARADPAADRREVVGQSIDVSAQAALRLEPSRPRRARCGTCASTGRLRPSRAGARRSARRGTRARGAAS